MDRMVNWCSHGGWFTLAIKDVKEPKNAQTVFQAIPDLICCSGSVFACMSFPQLGKNNLEKLEILVYKWKFKERKKLTFWKICKFSYLTKLEKTLCL
jgi:hypothetical protein